MLGAVVAKRRDWLAPAADCQEHLPAATRDALARAWLRDARLEHASIGAFAHFTLQLLAVGAPPDLVAAVQRAALDEVDHAREAYSLASRYAGQALGPGELSMPTRLAVSSLADAAAAAVHEGCVAETLSALQAYKQLQHAVDSQAKGALRRIADDEATHAALAYQFVRWAVSQGGEPVREAVRGAFAAAGQQLMAAEVRSDEPGLDVQMWRAHGRLTAAEEHACMLEGLRDVIAPCADALLQAA